MAEERSDVEEQGSADENTERIKRDIEQTRDEMGETIDEIQERLSFANLSDQVSEQVNNAVDTAKTALYEATVGKAVNIMKDVTNSKSGEAVVNTVKSNPIPFALIGVGAGLLAVQAYRGSSGGSRTNTGSKRSLSSAPDGAEKSDNASSSLSKVTGAVSDTVGTAYEKVGDLGGSALETYDRQIQDNPLAVGAVALAVGAAIGFAIPSTRYEGELMGGTRRQLLDTAQTAASDLVDQAKTAASDLVDQAKDAVGEAVSSAKA